MNIIVLAFEITLASVAIVYLYYECVSLTYVISIFSISFLIYYMIENVLFSSITTFLILGIALMKLFMCDMYGVYESIKKKMIVLVVYSLIIGYTEINSDNVIFSSLKYFIPAFIIMYICCFLNKGIHYRKISKIQALVILGCRLDSNDHPTRLLKMRLDKAIAILNSNINCKVILCGGAAHGEKISEAKAMEKELIE